MSMESDLYSALKALCPRVFPDVAPAATPRPFVTWQALGGQVYRNLDGSAADKRNTLTQVNVWADSRLAATTLIRQIENALCASSAFIARPEGEAVSDYDADTAEYGSLQRFTIISTR